MVNPPRHALISPAYLTLQRQLHATPRGYGGRGDLWAPIVKSLIREYQASSVLDYGCGQGTLAKALRMDLTGAYRISEYDPAIVGKDGPPVFADLVVCTDVLEHIEMERLATVLAHLQTLARKAIFVVVSTKESNKVLADGRNAHLIIRPAFWWQQMFRQAGFTLREMPPRELEREEWAAVLVPS